MRWNEIEWDEMGWNGMRWNGKYGNFEGTCSSSAKNEEIYGRRI